ASEQVDVRLAGQCHRVDVGLQRAVELAARERSRRQQQQCCDKDSHEIPPVGLWPRVERDAQRGGGVYAPRVRRANEIGRLQPSPRLSAVTGQRRVCQRARESSVRVTVASSTVGSQASSTGSSLNTTVLLSISRCSRKKAIPRPSPSIMRAPAPAERSGPSTNGIASSTEKALATVSASRRCWGESSKTCMLPN